MNKSRESESGCLRLSLGGRRRQRIKVICRKIDFLFEACVGRSSSLHFEARELTQHRDWDNERFDPSKLGSICVNIERNYSGVANWGWITIPKIMVLKVRSFTMTRLSRRWWGCGSFMLLLFYLGLVCLDLGMRVDVGRCVLRCDVVGVSERFCKWWWIKVHRKCLTTHNRCDQERKSINDSCLCGFLSLSDPFTHECVLNVKSLRPLPPFTLSAPPPSSSSETAPLITTLSGSKSGSM